MKIIVAGPRDFTDSAFVSRKLDRLTRNLRSVVIVTGACPTGVDRLAEEWAYKYMHTVERWHADWDKHGKGAAGLIRNRQMIEESGAKTLVAFWDASNPTSGTGNAITTARKAGLKVRLIAIHRKGKQRGQRIR